MRISLRRNLSSSLTRVISNLVLKYEWGINSNHIDNLTYSFKFSKNSNKRGIIMKLLKLTLALSFLISGTSLLADDALIKTVGLGIQGLKLEAYVLEKGDRAIIVNPKYFHEALGISMPIVHVVRTNGLSWERKAPIPQEAVCNAFGFNSSRNLGNALSWDIYKDSDEDLLAARLSKSGDLINITSQGNIDRAYILSVTCLL